MSDDDAEADSEVEDGDEEGPPAPGDMQRGLFRDFLDWKGLVLIEPTALTHNPDELSDYEKQRKARMANGSEPGHAQAAGACARSGKG